MSFRNPTITYNWEDAEAKVNAMKEIYGHGVSTRIIFENATSHDIIGNDSEDFSGRWEAEPPSIVSLGHGCRTVGHTDGRMEGWSDI